jgi:hypothetical protein
MPRGHHRYTVEAKALSTRISTALKQLPVIHDEFLAGQFKNVRRAKEEQRCCAMCPTRLVG